MTHGYTIDQLNGSLSVLRDDLIPGGTKRRALDILLKDFEENSIGYAGTIFGHGALALALSCQSLGKRAHLFLSCNDDKHPMLAILAKTNAKIVICAPRPIEELVEEAGNWEMAVGDAYVFPPGFRSGAFHSALTQALRDLSLPPYSEIWCSAVSGVLAGALKSAFPNTAIKIVSTVKSTDGDFHAPEKYHQAAQSPPPYPSCPYTDAKIWQFAKDHAAPNALIWNTAG